MAEILVKNMEMPKSCLGELNGKNDCPIVGICGIFKATPFKEKENIVWEQRLKDCPLVEVPPHGRLGDLDALGKLVFERKEKARDRGDWGVADGYMYARELVDDAPTVIEASKETEAR